MTKKAIRFVQAQLNSKGLDAGREDGILGTRTALLSKENGLVQFFTEDSTDILFVYPASTLWPNPDNEKTAAYYLNGVGVSVVISNLDEARFSVAGRLDGREIPGTRSLTNVELTFDSSEDDIRIRVTSELLRPLTNYVARFISRADYINADVQVWFLQKPGTTAPSMHLAWLTITLGDAGSLNMSDDRTTEIDARGKLTVTGRLVE